MSFSVLFYLYCWLAAFSLKYVIILSVLRVKKTCVSAWK